MVLKNSVLKNSDNLLCMGHVVLSPLCLEVKRLINPVFYHKRGQEKEQSSKGKTLFKNYRFLSEEIYWNGHNGLLLCSTCSHSSESHTCKFFAFPSDKKEKDKYKRWIRLITFVTALIIIFLLKEHHTIWRCFVSVRFPPTRNAEVIVTNV